MAQKDDAVIADYIQWLNLCHDIISRSVLDYKDNCPFGLIQETRCKSCLFHDIRMCKPKQIDIILSQA